LFGAPGGWTRFLTSTALATAAVVAVTGGQLPALPDFDQSTATAADDPGVPFDLDQAAQVRQDQCLLGRALRKGGPAMKEVARTGLVGTEEQLRTAANDDYWTATPLAAAFEKDKEAASAKLDELWARKEVWEKSLDVQGSNPPGYTVTGFEWVEDDVNPFRAIKLTDWVAGQFWKKESDFYDNPHPTASKESVDAATKIYQGRYSEDDHDDYEANRAWQSMQFMHAMYADDARLFLQYGGFPTTAPAPDSMEFRIDVENLKARFASCAYTNPPDPHGVLGTEVAAAATEWQDELAGQKTQRDAILRAEVQANADLTVASQALGESLAQSLIASRLTQWQAYWLKQDPEKAGLSYPDKAVFANVKKWIAQAQGRASGRLFVASRAALSAKKQADQVTKAQNEAYAVADKAGLPRGRGLLYGQQAAQVTKASAAATQAAAKAVETAYHATRASAADSKTLNALANTQAHAAKAEFRRKAAEEAAAQAKAASEGAAAQAVEAAKNAADAKAAMVRAQTAEKTAKSAAEDAQAKREVAEAERDYAKSQKELADSERARAATAKEKAEGQRQVAADKLSAARTAGNTAATKKNDAVAAEGKAAKARDKALEAESDRDVAEAKASALESRAAADEGSSDAKASRKAADEARAAADGATTAATEARKAADEATTAATNARAAATRAQGAAKRAQAAADGAKKDVAITEAAVAKAHAAAADAIDAADAAKWNAITAKSQAETAEKNAQKAKTDAVAARAEAKAAGADAVRTAGHAYATAQAATAASASALQVVKPANDAIELGAPYEDTDASAGLAVLTGQASKSAAEQQAALAKAKSAQAKKAAAEAKALAAKADADAKAAAEAAADAAEYAASAVKSAAEAQASSDAAAASAKAAKQAEANTVEYNRQAKEDAEAAQTAANKAGDYASEADAAATDAERDAASARSSASAAESDAGTARAVADQADRDATTAEKAAANADESADEAEKAAARTERAKAREVIKNGGATGKGGMFTKQKIKPLGEPQAMNPCELDGTAWDTCEVKFKLRYDVTVDFYMCRGSEDLDDGAASCPVDNITWLGSDTFENQTGYMTKTFTTWDITKMVDKAFLNLMWDMFVQDFVDCSKGSVSGCAWAASNFVPGKWFEDAYSALRGLDKALKSGRGIDEALAAVKKLDIDPKVKAAIEAEADILEAAFTSCTRNSFPGDTPVLMADGSHRAISEVRLGELVLASDPDTGELRARPVTDTFRHDTERLVDVVVADGSTLTSTAGHKFYVVDRGWTLVSDLRVGDLMQAPDGSRHAVTALHDRSGLAPRQVYDLTVGGLHTFFVEAEGVRPQDVLVHNCLDITLHQGDRGAHTLSDHVDITPADAIRKAKANFDKGRPGVNGVWTDAETAQRAVDKAFKLWTTGLSPSQSAANRRKLKKWLDETPVDSESPTDLLSFNMKLSDEGSLGRVYHHTGGDPTKAGNTVTITLKRSKHKPRYMVYTAYPS
jgi:hypothetical protein